MNMYNRILTMLNDAMKAAGGPAALQRLLDCNKATFYRAINKDDPTLPNSRTLCRWLDILNVQLQRNTEISGGFSTIPQIAPADLVDVQNAPELGRMALPRSWFSERRIDPNTCVVVRGLELGDTVRSVDDVLIDTAQTEPVEGGVYAVSLKRGQLPMLRRFQMMPGALWQLSSDSANRPTVIIEEADICYYGRAVWVGRNGL
ncbi:MAG: hypothetical protein K6E40_16680 [Desulfovibrio sp.]|nr:hypothetical protein [Desulfovibrio sp.]